MTSAIDSPRRHLFRIMACAVIGMISIAVAVDHVRLTREIASHRTDDLHPQVSLFAKRLATLEHSQATLDKRPIAATAYDLASTTHILGDRLTALERAAQHAPDTSDLPALRDRMAALEARQKIAAASLPAIHHALAKHAAEHPPKPPFTLLGPELRAGESFLTVAPPGTQSLEQVRLLRVGDSLGGWTLIAMDQDGATFRVGDQLERLAIP